MSIVLDGSNQTTGGLINAGTAVASTSGTTITFTGIPSTAKRITVMFNGVSFSASAQLLIQMGSGSLITTGYLTQATVFTGSGVGTGTSVTSGILGESGSGSLTSSTVRYGHAILTLVSGNTWVGSINTQHTGTTTGGLGAGSISLAGALDRVAITTVAGTATFTAGSINIFWE
jgi:hypothetical protein